MTGITITINERRKAGITHLKKDNPKTNMTPMVDLGFLLITFFVITTELSRPATMDLIMPEEGPPMTLGKSDVLTVLLRNKNSIYYYQGDWEEALTTNQIFQANFSGKNGLRKLIREKQLLLDSINTKNGRGGLMLLIKAGEDADYGDIIDIMDEALINDVKKYALLKADKEEMKYLATRK